MIKVMLLKLDDNFYLINFQNYRKPVGELQITFPRDAFPRDASLMVAVSGLLVWNRALNWDICVPWL